MSFLYRVLPLIFACSIFSFAQNAVKVQPPEVFKDSSSGEVQKIDFTSPLSGVNDPGMLFAHFSGKPLLIYYFSPKCPHCQSHFPSIQELVKKYEAQGLLGMGISIGGGIKKNDIRLFIDQFNASIPIFQDVNTKFGPRYGTGYVPVVFVVNKDGSYYRFSDLSKKSDEQLENLIKELLK